VGKPVTPTDATNTGYMEKSALGQAVVRANKEGNWRAGVMLWQFASDEGGQTINAVAGQLRQLCEGKH
jgi:chitinase